jgi:hypothetical protein
MADVEMTKKNMKYDEVGLYPSTYAVTLSGLSETQATAVTKAIKGAINPSGTVVNRILAAFAGISVLMVFVALCIWIVAFLLTSLPGR